MDDAASVKTDVNAAVTALRAGDYATARTRVMAARAGLIAIADSTRDRTQVQRDRQFLNDLMKQINRAEAAASDGGGFRRQGFKFVSPGCTSN